MQLTVQDNNRSLLVASTPFPSLKSRRKKALKQAVVDRLLSKDEFLKTALLAIYSKQTPQEQRRGRTISRNHRGFNASDVHVFGPMAERVVNGEELCERDLAVCRTLLPNGIPWLGKYRSQLAESFRDELLSSAGADYYGLSEAQEEAA